MPWSNQGGNQGGNNGGGPWGQGPRGPNGGGGGGGGNQPPDLDEIIRQGQDKIKRIFPQGGGGGGSSKMLIILAVVAGLALIGYQGANRIQPDEQGVVFQLGKVDRILEPGLNFTLWPIEKVEKLQVTKEHNMVFRRGDNSMLAGDQNIVDIEFTVQWRISSANDYLLNLRDPLSLIRVVSESAMRDVVGRTPAETVRTKGRAEVQAQVKALIQATLDSYKSGIKINGVQLEKADPPREVADAFEEVQRAEQEQNKLIREAERYRNRLLGEARGEAAQIVEKAKAYKARVVAEAEGEAQRFIKVYDEYAKAKDVTRQRLFLETMEQILANSNKIILEGKGGTGVVPYLPLPEVQKNLNRNRPQGGTQ